MKPERPVVVFWLAAVLVTVISGWVWYLEYRDMRKECTGQLDRSLESAIHQEIEIRLKKNKMHFSYGHQMLPANQTIIEQESGITVIDKQDSATNRLSFHERQSNVQQTILYLEGIPINVNVLDSIFHALLMENKTIAPTAVRYTDNLAKTGRFSRNDTAFYRSASGTLPKTIGVQGEITVQGYGMITPVTVIGKRPQPFVIIASAWLTVTASLVLFVILKKRRIRAVPSGEINEHPVEHPHRIQITGDIAWDQKTHLILYHSQEIKLSPLMATLFEFLWNCPEHFATYEELILQVYGTESLTNAGNRLSQAVKRLRNQLVKIPELDIENVPNKGYRLFVKQLTVSDDLRNEDTNADYITRFGAVVASNFKCKE